MADFQEYKSHLMLNISQVMPNVILRSNKRMHNSVCRGFVLRGNGQEKFG